MKCTAKLTENKKDERRCPNTNASRYVVTKIVSEEGMGAKYIPDNSYTVFMILCPKCAARVEKAGYTLLNK